MHDDDLGPDIYWKGFDAGYAKGWTNAWSTAWWQGYVWGRDHGATTPSEQKGMTEVLPTSDHSAESVPPDAQVAPVRGTPCQ